MRSRIFFKLMLVFLVVIAVTAVTLEWTVHRVWERTLHEQIERDLTQKVQMFAYSVENDRQHTLADITSQEGQAAGARATVIDPTGKVLADSEADPASMENHAYRKEFAAALAGHIGVDERKSHTLAVPFIYVAAPVSGGAVRLAYPLPEIEITNRPLSRVLFWGSLTAFVIAALDRGGRVAVCGMAFEADRPLCRTCRRRRLDRPNCVHVQGRDRPGSRRARQDGAASGRKLRPPADQPK